MHNFNHDFDKTTDLEIKSSVTNIFRSPYLEKNRDSQAMLP